MHIDAVVVPRGAEAQAVARGWGDGAPPMLLVPAGAAAGHGVTLTPSAATVVVMGLCGGLDPALRVGEAVAYSHVMGDVPFALDPQLTAACAAALACRTVSGVTADAVVGSRAAKAALRAATGAAAVDMEAASLAASLARRDVRVAMVRVVSDDAHGDLPDLRGVYDEHGALRPFVLAAALVRAPVRGARFIAGALTALSALRTAAAGLARG